MNTWPRRASLPMMSGTGTKRVVRRARARISLDSAETADFKTSVTSMGRCMRSPRARARMSVTMLRTRWAPSRAS